MADASSGLRLSAATLPPEWRSHVSLDSCCGEGGAELEIAARDDECGIAVPRSAPPALGENTRIRVWIGVDVACALRAGGVSLVAGMLAGPASRPDGGGCSSGTVASRCWSVVAPG